MVTQDEDHPKCIASSDRYTTGSTNNSHNGDVYLSDDDDSFDTGHDEADETEPGKNDDATTAVHPSCSTQRFRIRINVSNLPLSIKGVIRGGSGRGGASAAAAPDTYVVVTTSERYLDVANDTNTNSIDSTDTLTSRQNNDESIWGRTEIVKASYNPQFTTTIPFEYNYATPTATPNRTILFYVHVFRQFSNRNIHRYGTAQFSALDLIYTKNMIRMKRLRDTDSSISNKNSKYLNADVYTVNWNGS